MTVTSPRGFRAAGFTAGIKASGRPDLALVVNDGPLNVAAGVFTGNRFRAAPVLWSQQVVSDGVLRAVILNSGGANACTGPEGFLDTHRTAERTSEVLTALGTEIGAGDIAVCSTGLIGERLPMDRINAGIDAIAPLLSDDGGADARERPHGRARLRRRDAGQRGDQDRAGLGLPPRVYDGAPAAADDGVVPHPRLRVDRLAHTA